MAIKIEIPTAKRVLLEIALTIFDSVAPITFRIPISLMRFCELYKVNPKSPREAMNMARMEKIRVMAPVRFSSA